MHRYFPDRPTHASLCTIQSPSQGVHFLYLLPHLSEYLKMSSPAASWHGAPPAPPGAEPLLRQSSARRSSAWFCLSSFLSVPVRPSSPARYTLPHTCHPMTTPLTFSLGPELPSGPTQHGRRNPGIPLPSTPPSWGVGGGGGAPPPPPRVLLLK